MKLRLLNEKKDSQYKYSCVMFRLPDNIAKEVIGWGKKNINKDDLHKDSEDESCSGFENDIHVTVKYGLHDPDPACIADLIKDFGSFDIKFDKVSKFESDDYDVIKIAVKSDKLRELNKLISNNTKITDEYPDYKPHATIAYVKKGSCRDLLGRDDFANLTATCKEVIFSSKASDDKTKLPIC